MIFGGMDQIGFKDKSQWPSFPESQEKSCEKVLKANVCSVQTEDIFTDRFSKLEHLQRVMAFCLRIKHRIPRVRENLTKQNTYKPPQTLHIDEQKQLSVSELRDAYIQCIKICQKSQFPEEINALQKGHNLKVSSSIIKLDPFLDLQGILRVGGRLQNSHLPFEEKHPAILLGSSHMARLIIDWAHRMALHGGFRVTTAFALRRIWLVRETVHVKAYLRSCVQCAKLRAKLASQKMAPLPMERVIRNPAFTETGLDYAGPIKLHMSKGRGAKTYKGYIALFVCLCTKAVHLEVVGDLQTDSFIGALKRFIGRRGKPAEIWSDNASTFQGADAELRALLMEAKDAFKEAPNYLSNEGINWRFVPPKAPHFGGIWEAGIKSAKSHLKKVLGSRILTFEEMSTLLVQIEMVLNSRPLIPFSGEIDDLDILTPGHFLRGAALNQLPTPIKVPDKIDHLSHWKLVEALRNQFWLQWSRDYLHTLQQRVKWPVSKKNIRLGEIVSIVDASLLKDGRWPLGRVINIFPGKDGLVRTVQVQTSDSTYIRPIAKLAPLPVLDSTPSIKKKTDNKKQKTK